MSRSRIRRSPLILLSFFSSGGEKVDGVAAANETRRDEDRDEPTRTTREAEVPTIKNPHRAADPEI